MVDGESRAVDTGLNRRRPQHIAAVALRTIGALAAGDATCVARRIGEGHAQVLMPRIGLHNGLLFRVKERTLGVLYLVARESLMKALK
jgi:hypothetical protein